jgi:hypothetical protein
MSKPHWTIEVLEEWKKVEHLLDDAEIPKAVKHKYAYQFEKAIELTLVERVALLIRRYKKQKAYAAENCRNDGYYSLIDGNADDAAYWEITETEPKRHPEYCSACDEVHYEHYCPKDFEK